MDIIIKYITETHPDCFYKIQDNLIFVKTLTGIITYDINYLKYILK